MTHKYINLEDTTHFYFGANDTSGSGGDGATPAAHVRLAGAAASAAPVLSPTPSLLTSATYPDGCYEVEVAATVANGFGANNEYAVFHTLAIDSQNPTGFCGSFKTAPVPATVENLASGSSAISTKAESFTLTTGSQVNSYTDTFSSNGVYHILNPFAGTTDGYYQFDVGADGVPVRFLWLGYAQGTNDTYTVYVYDWDSAVWDPTETIIASNGANIQSLTFQAAQDHVGTGANNGKVRLRFESTNGSEIATDRVWCSYSVVNRSVGYSVASISVDTNASNTGTTPFIDGTGDNPVSTWAAALSLYSQTGIKRFELAATSAITLTSDSSGFTIAASGSQITLNGQSLNGARIFGARIIGNDDGSNTTETIYRQCLVSTNTLGQHIFDQCLLLGPITLAEAGDYVWDQCLSFVAGNGTPDVTFPVGVTNMNIRHYSGGIQVKSMAAGHTISLEGMGQFKADASVTGGAVSVRGTIGPMTGAGIGNITFTENARIADDTVADAGLKRDWTLVEGEAARSTLNALRFLRNKWDVAGTTLTVTKEDDSTTAWTGTVTTDAAADPITGSDPT